MPVVRHSTREIQFKIVYYGPGLGGKTTNLELIHRRSNPSSRGKLVSLNTESERTLFFDLLPVDLGSFRGYRVRLHLCTVPGQLAYDETRRLVLRNVDGIVFVVDSQRDRLDANVQSIRNLETNLLLQGDDPASMPLVVQYNKRDLPTALAPDALREALGVPPAAVEVQASAVNGVGVFDTFKEITRACMHVVGDPRRAPEGRSVSLFPDQRNSTMFPVASLGPAARSEAVHNRAVALGIEIPKPPRIPRLFALP